LWAVAALYFDIRVAWLRVPSAALYACLTCVLLWLTLRNLKAIRFWLASLIAVMAWWLSLPPTNVRAWQPDVARLPWADRHGDLITLHNVRNFDYRTETDYIQRLETETVDLSQLRGVDLFLTHFGSPLICARYRKLSVPGWRGKRHVRGNVH
jgi:hypothetical protein